MTTEDAARFSLRIPVETAHLDENGHVNNVAYVQWMQDIAVRHATHVGCTAETNLVGASWYARSHHIEYKTPAFAGDVVLIHTEVGALQVARSTRTYRFVRESDGRVLATASTEWVFVDASSGRPRPIPPIMSELFGL